MFTGLISFPLTPLMNDSAIDVPSFERLMQRQVQAQVSMITVLGSTGSYAYLNRDERAMVIKHAVAHASSIPVMAGIGSVRTRDVLTLAEDAQRAGAKAVLMAPVSYQKLQPDEVYGLFEMVTRELSVPLCVYDNPATTQFHFSDELLVALAALPQVASIKIPALTGSLDEARARVRALKAHLPATCSLGVSGDHAASLGLQAGCDGWYSVLGGLLPQLCMRLLAEAKQPSADGEALSAAMQPLWALFKQHGSVRVVAAVAELLGLVQTPCLPLPLHSLQGEERAKVAAWLASLPEGFTH
ncbi:dihydrodipicolinate synthase family protein [Paenalcaligenes sp. Me131]|uniref:dihydrodipicolinate synthase family protein n=1 Tax=Paenalcaligenes sp. Me131 TaxID=3392636 RepID=UPI003D2CFC3A